MRRLGGFVIAVVLIAFVAGRAQQLPPPTFRARTDAVTVAVSVKDGRQPVPGLGAADFELLDNGVPQAIDVVSLDRIAIDVTLVLTGYDDRASAEHLQGLVKASEVQKLLTPADRLRIVDVGDRVRGRLVGPGFAVPTGHEKTEQIPGIAVIDGLFYALAWPVEPDRRHLVVAFTDGWDSWSTLEAARLKDIATHSDAVFHTVFWRTPNDIQRMTRGDTPDQYAELAGKPKEPDWVVREWERGYRAVIAAVDRTGGTYRSASASTDAFKSILDDFRTSYLLQYTPRGTDAKGWHELKVRVTRRGSYAIRARQGYEAR